MKSKIRKREFIFLLLFIQLTLAITAGFFVLSLAANKNIPPYVYIKEISIGNMNRAMAQSTLEAHLGETEKNKRITIKTDKEEEYSILYSDIDAKFDFTATLDQISNTKGVTLLANLVNGYFVRDYREKNPILSYDESKLRSKVQELAMVINREPLNANIYLRDDKILKVPEALGAKLNIDKTMMRIKMQFSEDNESSILLTKSSKGEIEELLPQIVSAELAGVEEIISRHTTEIKNTDQNEEIIKAINTIHKILIQPYDPKGKDDTGYFSFNKYLALENGMMEKNNEGYNQVVSTLYAAVLKAGIEKESITRTPSDTPVDYIQPGLDAIVYGKNVDFKFKNTLGNKMIIFAEIKGNKVTVCLAGKKKNPNISTDLEVEIKQKEKPAVINLENQSLKPGEKRIVNAGKEGLLVYVYRITGGIGMEEDKKLLYTNQYKAVDTIVQVGPNAKWDSKTNIK